MTTVASGIASEIRLIGLSGIGLVREGDDLKALIVQALAASSLSLLDGDVLVIAQKIVSKSEGRLRKLSTVSPSNEAVMLAQRTGKDARLIELILSESAAVLRYTQDLIIVEHRLGFVMANAGIDQSNVDSGPEGDSVLLLPSDPDGSCAAIRQKLREQGSADVGVIINDSHGRAWRNGTVGVAIGVAGLPAVVDLRGTPDLYDRKLRSTEIGLADEIAAAASLLMGQSAEGRPVVLVRGVPYARRDGCSHELVRARERDLFR
jgi:coenzyme F420-0:L-glutamate ligase/coenzyme F420-1:gamma-L-glutamate ligase